MELLLNLGWLLLAVPALWLWLGLGSRRFERAHRVSSGQGLLVLGCVLAILFPVISATDDLCAMRAELEESPVSKRIVLQACSDKSSARYHGVQSPPALLGASLPFGLRMESRKVAISTTVPSSAAPSAIHSVRAPPVFSLA
jgi:hypothetical protein